MLRKVILACAVFALVVLAALAYWLGSSDAAIAYIAHLTGTESQALSLFPSLNTLGPTIGLDGETFTLAPVMGGVIDSDDHRDEYGECIERDCEIVVGYPNSYVRKFSSTHRDPTTCLCNATCDSGWDCTRKLQDGSTYVYAVKQVDFATGECSECPLICPRDDGSNVSEEYCMITATDGTRMKLKDASGNDVLKSYDCQCPSACPNGSMTCSSGEDRIYQPGDKYHCKCPAEKRLEIDNMTHACQTFEGGNFTNMYILAKGDDANDLNWSSWYNCYPEDNDFAPGRYPADSNSECQCLRGDLQKAVDNTRDMSGNAYYNVCQSTGIEEEACGRATAEEIQKYECTDLWGLEKCRKKTTTNGEVRLRSHVEKTETGIAFDGTATTAPSYTHPCNQQGNPTNKQLQEGLDWNEIRWRGEECVPEANDFAPGFYDIPTGPRGESGSVEDYCNYNQLEQAVNKAWRAENLDEKIAVCGNEHQPHGFMSARELRKYDCEDDWGSTDCRTKTDGSNLRRHVYAPMTADEADGSKWN